MPTTPGLNAGPYTLRGWTKADVEFVTRAASDADIARYSSVGQGSTPAAASRWIESRWDEDRLDWVVELKGKPIGRVSLAHVDHVDQVAEVGYWILAPFRRQGVASHALDALESFAFSTLDLFRLCIRHEPENVASCALAGSRGYDAEGTQRSAFSRDGVRRDLHVHALLASSRTTY